MSLCKLCYEPNAIRRQCCRSLFCDYCYVKLDFCPHCKAETKAEAKTGATFQVKVLSEHEECRRCLDPGLIRRCCGRYYCDNCYYSAPACRSCGYPIGKNLLYLFLILKIYYKYIIYYILYKITYYLF